MTINLKYATESVMDWLIKISAGRGTGMACPGNMANGTMKWTR